MDIFVAFFCWLLFLSTYFVDICRIRTWTDFSSSFKSPLKIVQAKPLLQASCQTLYEGHTSCEFFLKSPKRRNEHKGGPNLILNGRLGITQRYYFRVIVFVDWVLLSCPTAAEEWFGGASKKAATTWRWAAPRKAQIKPDPGAGRATLV